MTRIWPNNRAGWSLIETMIVLTVTGILATMSYAYMLSAVPHAQLEKSELILNSALLKARSLAISNEVPTKVAFFHGGDPRKFCILQLDPTSSTWSIVGAPTNMSDGVTFTVTTFPANEARFSTRGTLQSGGWVKFTNSTKETSVLIGNVVTGRFQIGKGNLR